LADLEVVERGIERAGKRSKSGDKEQIKLKELLEKVRNHLNEGMPVRSMDLDEDDFAAVKRLCLMTQKPTMYIANVSEDGFESNPLLDKVTKLAEEIAELEDEEKIEFLQELGLEEPGLNRVIRAGYELLGLQTYFTAGQKEVRAWTVRVGATAPQAAGVIHTDFERGFIRAEVTAYKDYDELNGEQGAKEAGKFRLEGKDYIMADGDVVHFRFNV